MILTAPTIADIENGSCPRCGNNFFYGKEEISCSACGCILYREKPLVKLDDWGNPILPRGRKRENRIRR